MGTFDIDDDTNELSTTVKLFLGNLDRTSLGTGYGLYAENVYLDGSLTTKSVNTKYAGVNTYNGVSKTKNIKSSELIEIIEDKSENIETVWWITNNPSVKENITSKILVKKILGKTEVEEI